MTEVLHSSSSSSSSSLQTHDTSFFHSVNQEPEESSEAITRVADSQQDYHNNNNNNNNINNDNHQDEDDVNNTRDRDRDNHQLSLLALLLTLFRKSFWVSSSNKNTEEEDESTLDLSGMEIGWPTDVRHVAHVTFDRFNGFLGLPVEFEPEVLRRAPSASATVFGVSTESMQLSYDSRGNSIPTILILMQQRLYSQGGLKAEGIFRINPENSQEEDLRNQLNSGIVPEGIDVHCLSGLIKAWFRELPTGVLDPLSPEQVMQCQSEEDCAALCRLLPPTETALLDWAINLMADVVQHEQHNKMNSHNIAMVFAPNMTQMADPLTALMYAVQVMNFLKTLITKTLREREDPMIESSSSSQGNNPRDENDQHQGSLLNPHHQQNENEEKELQFITDDDHLSSYLSATEEADGIELKTQENHDCDLEKNRGFVEPVMEKSSKGISNLSSINSQSERIEAWR